MDKAFDHVSYRCTALDFKDDKEGKRTLSEHESHATAVLGLLFADSGGDGYENATERFTRTQCFPLSG